ncbi:DNA mismatch repair protein MutS [Yeosuana sp. MJ-SS3]|uniref:DNA mismatch repair protein MutS n=1 Tax=Gilvirhabdus luticola TaxID=3079858 RepID=A0ABU3U9S2_9FLAO|nr:DNA mismatch repair protein MutS [Yeosuana sp. MJ-SS3]MDU8887150.1 DNA mismatch repair protein MutS [Yeosuana sp. MJ-SS3]
MGNNFKIGDSVTVLDEDLSGIITAINKDEITIETTEGFSLNFSPSELIKDKADQDFKKELFSNTDLDSVISEKESPKKNRKSSIKAKERYQPTMEVDLHINQLVKSSKGMSHHDMLTLQLETAKRQLEFAIRKRIQKVVFIHGVGEGVLKVELEYLFGRYNVKYYDANYQKYGLGATEVYIYQNINSN